MSPTPEELLEIADPFEGAHYAHPDLDGMLERIQRSPSDGAGTRRRRAPSRRILVGVVAACLIGAAAVVLAPSSPSASGLELVARYDGTQRVALAPTTPPALGWSTGVIFGQRPAKTWVFAPGHELSRAAGAAVGSAIVAPADAAAFTRHLARILGLAGRATGHGGADPRWAVGSTTSARAFYEIQGGVPIFGYTRDACEFGAVLQGDGVGCPPHPWRPHGGQLAQIPGMPSHARLNAIAIRFVHRLGFGYSIGLPTYGPLWIDPASVVCRHACRRETIGYSTFFHGEADGQGVGVSFDARGVIVAATGPALALGSLTRYQLLSPVAAIASLNDTLPTQTGPDGGDLVPLGRCHATRCRIRQLPPWPVGHATLHSVAIVSAIYVKRGGGLVALPTYVYSNATIDGPASHHPGTLFGMWYELAVLPSLAHVSGTAWG